MEIAQVAGIALIAAILVLVLRKEQPVFAILISIAAGVLLIWIMSGRLISAITALTGLADRVEVDETYLSTILKVIGVSYLAEFASHTCRDAGETALAAKVEMAGKAIILAMSIPVMASLLELLLGMIP